MHKTKANLAEEEDSEEDGVESISTKSWDVPELSELHRASLHSAEISVVEES